MRVGKISEWVEPGEEVRFRQIKLKPMQIAIINCSRHSDVLVNLPTGFGKSLLFQYPASMLVDCCVLVFVPLKALLWDCLKEAQLFEVSATEVTPAFIKQYQKDNKLPQLLFLTPERLFKNDGVLSFIDMLHAMNKISFIVIDEAHCISEWGSDFRPDYGRLCEVRRMFQGVRVLGMSATMPMEARKDLVQRLKIPTSYYFQSSSNRANLIYEIKEVQKKRICREIVQYIASKGMNGQPGIIYCQTIRSAEEVFQELRQQNFNCCLFHSKLTEKKRQENFDGFMNEQIKVIVATICFGMGVNKKNIRYVINVGVSMSAQNYYQQSGRAGRDGDTSFCLLMTYKTDVNPIEYLINQSNLQAKIKKRKIQKLHQLKQYTKANECRKKVLFSFLGEEFTPQQCKKTCDFCVSEIVTEYQQIDYSERAMKVMEQIVFSRAKLTKIQLSKVLKGQDPKIKNGAVNQKIKVLKGLLKDEPLNKIQLLIETLVNLKLLITKLQFGKGKFKMRIEYLQPCSKTFLKQHSKVILKIKKTVSKIQKQPTENIPISEKFNKYLTHKRVKTQPDRFPQFGGLPSNNKEKSLKQHLASLDAEYKNKYNKDDNIKNKKIEIESNQLEQIKMVPISEEYHSYMDQLFGSDLDAQIEKQQGNLPDEEQPDCHQQMRTTQFQSFEGQKIQTPLYQPPKQLPNQQAEEKSEDQSFDEEFISKIRYIKERKAETKKQETVVRKKMFDFI